MEKKKKKPSFLAGVKAEFSRITWPGRKDVRKRFLVVLIVSILAALLIAGTDTLIQAGIELIIGALP